ncbi:hypothetical protein R3I93_015046 [Phoxinus phoxinus]|uniref:SWIM-type domain-containing protein n=1 Tax=Phoxinus phoxinus TaxID=58324 RepID=A0AAN9CQV2_9TELE
MSTCTLLDRIINRVDALSSNVLFTRQKQNQRIRRVREQSVCSLCTPEGFTQLGLFCPHIFSLMPFQTRINVSFHAVEVMGPKKKSWSMRYIPVIVRVFTD